MTLTRSQKNSRTACALALAVCVFSAPCFAGRLIITDTAAPILPGLPSAPPPALPALAPPGAFVARPAVPNAVIPRTAVLVWNVESSDVRLSTTFDRWSKAAGYNLIWDAEKQVLLSAKDSFTGTLEQAIARVLSSPAIRRSDFPLEACFYPNSPPVIRITRLGDQAINCPQ